MRDKIIAEIKKVPVIAKHTKKQGIHIGNNVYIAPICVWTHDIEVLVDTKRNVFKKALAKFVAEHDEVKNAYFVHNGEATPFVRFELKD